MLMNARDDDVTRYRKTGRLVLAFGPELPGWGSWDWVGSDLAHALAGDFDTRTFRAWEEPVADAVLVIKQAPERGWVERIARRSALLYAPVDFSGGIAAIDADAALLRHCDRVLVHCDRLRRYFEPYARVESFDHHVKFTAPMRTGYRTEGNILWAGVRSNLLALVEWINVHGLPGPLDILTNLEDAARPPSPAQLGMRDDVPVRIHDWSPARHVEMTAAARGFLDIKGDDFRARHKPPAKGIDAIASGVPLAMNPGSSTVEHLARMGFEVASPLDPERWFSRGYWEETQRFGLALRELLSPERIGRRLRRIVEEVLTERHGPVMRQGYGNIAP